MDPNPKEVSKRALQFEISVCTLIRLIAHENPEYEVKCDKSRLLGTEPVSRRDVRPCDNRRSNPDCTVEFQGSVIVIDAKNSSRTKISKADVEKSRQDGMIRGSEDVILVLQEDSALQDNAYDYCEENDIHIIQLVKRGLIIKKNSSLKIQFEENEYINYSNMKILRDAIDVLFIGTPPITFRMDNKINPNCRAVRNGEDLSTYGYRKNNDGTVDKRMRSWKTWKEYKKNIEDKNIFNYDHQAASERFRDRKYSRDSQSSGEETQSTRSSEPLPDRQIQPIPQNTHHYKTRSRARQDAIEAVSSSRLASPHHPYSPSTSSSTVMSQSSISNHFEESLDFVKQSIKHIQDRSSYSTPSSQSSQATARREIQANPVSVIQPQKVPFQNSGPERSIRDSSEQQSYRPTLVQDPNTSYYPSFNPTNNSRPLEPVDCIRRDTTSNHRLYPMLNSQPVSEPSAFDRSVEFIKRDIKKQGSYSQNCSRIHNSSPPMRDYVQSRSYNDSESMFFNSELGRLQRNVLIQHSQTRTPSQNLPVAYHERQFYMGYVNNIASTPHHHANIEFFSSREHERATLT
jgi:hypothetical protein